MIRLDQNNYRLYAAQNYSNNCCLGEDEFKRDLSLATRIMTQIDHIMNDHPKGNILLLVNQVITFFNVFRYPASKNLILYLTEPYYHPKINTILVNLERLLPSDIPDVGYCEVILDKMKREFE